MGALGTYETLKKRNSEEPTHGQFHQWDNLAVTRSVKYKFKTKEIKTTLEFLCR